MSRRRLLGLGLSVVAGVIVVAGCQSDPSPTSLSAPLVTSLAPTQPTSPPVVAAPTASAPTRSTTRPTPRSSSSVEGLIRYASGQPLPNSRLTPGEAFASAGPSAFCVSGYTTKVRHVTDSLRYQVFAEYHIPYAQHSAYEVDHLIPLELGGDNSIKNLWPEKGSIPNPKDGLENQLHNLVCHGQLSTATAQHAIASNWVAALHTYGSSGSVYERSSSSTTTSSTSGSGATAKCNDGTYSYAAHHQGACSSHGGVAIWYR